MRRYSLLVFVMVILIGMGSPVMAQFSGSYDVGGGNMDFGSPVGAASLISINGVTGPVICNIYSGTMWTGRLNFPHNIPGVSPVNTITFRNAPGHSPVLTMPYYNNNIIYMNSADYITIEGLEFSGCEETAIYFEGSESDSCREIRMIGNYVHDFGTNLYTNSTGIRGYYSADCEIIGNEVDGDTWGISIRNSDRSLIANNMVYDCAPGINPGISSCIAVYYGANNLVYHNSARSVSSNILICGVTEDITIYNNAFTQAGTGDDYVIGMSSSSSGVSDYNDFYAPGSYVGYDSFLGLIQTLSEWQDAMGQDVNSISTNPRFASWSNLHIVDPSPVGFAGIAVPEVTDDYDGDSRKTPTPDIGADEYIYPLAGSYDINGGGNDFATIDEAITQAITIGLGDHVYFNVFSDTYNGQINIPDIPSTDASRTLTIQAASGETPIITNTVGATQTDGNGFYLIGADYITIEGFEITSCYADGISNYIDGADSSNHNQFIRNYIHGIGTGGDYAGIHLYKSAGCEVLRNEINGDDYGIECSYSNGNLLANNMIYYCTNTGIYDDQGTDNQYYYNTVYQETSPSTTYDFYAYHCTDVDLKNNIFFHDGSGTHYALSIVGNLASFPVTSDYNDLYAPSAYVGYYGGNQTTLANWQTATGLDSNSISADPSFVSLITPNLHINPFSPVETAGIFVPEVTYDFDGDSRYIGQPDIGADEIVSPMAGTFDIGGGAMDFETIREGVQALNDGGMAGPVTFNVFTELYHGQVDITSSISGLGAANPLIIQNAPGESPQTRSTMGRGFQITSVDYVTIQGIEIHHCDYEGIRILGGPADSVSNIRILNNYIHDVGTSISGIHHALVLTYGVDCEITGNEIDGDDFGLSSSYGTDNLFANNMIYSCLEFGINNFRGNGDQYYYNSVYVDQGSGFAIRQSNGLVIKNNSIFNDGFALGADYSCYYLQDVSLPSITSDYNNLYAPRCYVGYITNTGTSYTTLLQWQTATGWDANSISADPGYVSTTTPFDLHITDTSPLESTATPIVSITVDFDGETRDLVFPDIGADELVPAGPPDDIQDLVITLSSGTDDSTNITLTWSHVSGAQQYHIYKSTTDPQSGFTLIGSVADTTYTDSNVLIDELKSFYYVTADNEPIDVGFEGRSSQNMENHRILLPSTYRKTSP